MCYVLAVHIIVVIIIMQHTQPNIWLREMLKKYLVTVPCHL